MVQRRVVRPVQQLWFWIGPGYLSEYRESSSNCVKGPSSPQMIVIISAVFLNIQRQMGSAKQSEQAQSQDKSH